MAKPRLPLCLSFLAILLCTSITIRFLRDILPTFLKVGPSLKFLVIPFLSLRTLTWIWSGSTCRMDRILVHFLLSCSPTNCCKALQSYPILIAVVEVDQFRKAERCICETSPCLGWFAQDHGPKRCQVAVFSSSICSRWRREKTNWTANWSLLLGPMFDDGDPENKCRPAHQFSFFITAVKKLKPKFYKAEFAARTVTLRWMINPAGLQCRLKKKKNAGGWMTGTSWPPRGTGIVENSRSSVIVAPFASCKCLTAEGWNSARNLRKGPLCEMFYRGGKRLKEAFCTLR